MRRKTPVLSKRLRQLTEGFTLSEYSAYLSQD